MLLFVRFPPQLQDKVWESNRAQLVPFKQKRNWTGINAFTSYKYQECQFLSENPYASPNPNMYAPISYTATLSFWTWQSAAIHGFICTVHQVGQLPRWEKSWDIARWRPDQAHEQLQQSWHNSPELTGMPLDTSESVNSLQTPAFPLPLLSTEQGLSATSSPGSRVIQSNVEFYRPRTGIRTQLCPKSAALTIIFFFGGHYERGGRTAWEKPGNGRKNEQ